MTLLGSTTPRIYTPPLVKGAPGPCGCGCALTRDTSLGFSAVDFATEVLGVEPLPWQRWLLIHSMELRRDKRFRFRTILVLVSRQNGKTTIVEVKNLWKMFVLRVPLVIGTAQNLDIAEESWDKAVEIVESIPELAAEVPKDGGVIRVNGKKALKLLNGSRWKVAAASRRGGRGLSGDDVNLDELREHQAYDSWAAVTKTTMARANAQIWAYSNAGDDKSVVLNDLQAKGRAAAAAPPDEAGTLGHFEWSAPDDCPIDDERATAQANPSVGYPQGISWQALSAARETDPEPVYRTECLCQRVPNLVPSKIPLPAWVNCKDPKSQIDDGVVLAWDVSWDGNWAAIAAAGYRRDGLPHIEVAEYRQGTDWVAGRLAEICARQPILAVFVDPGSPAGSLLAEVTDLLPVGMDPQTLTGRDMAHACGRIYNAVVGGRRDDGSEMPAARLRHLGDTRLLEALRKSATRSLADAWAWDRKRSGIDISPLVAVTVALHGLAVQPPRRLPAPPPLVVRTAGARTETGHLATAGF